MHKNFLLLIFFSFFGQKEKNIELLFFPMDVYVSPKSIVFSLRSHCIVVHIIGYQVLKLDYFH
jgi:hypothetical protein